MNRLRDPKVLIGLGVLVVALAAPGAGPWLCGEALTWDELAPAPTALTATMKYVLLVPDVPVVSTWLNVEALALDSSLDPPFRMRYTL